MDEAPQPVLDSWAVLAYLHGEPAGAVVRDRLEEARQAGRTLPLCVVNWGEVLYRTFREKGPSEMERVAAAIEGLPISIVDADPVLTIRAAALKGRLLIAYADAYCAALALALGAPVLTGDPEFRRFEPELEVLWLS